MKQTSNDPFENARKIYNDIEIPEELNDLVRNTIEAHENSKTVPFKKKNQQKILPFIKWAGNIAAVLLITLTIGLNASEAFADTLSDMPVVGALARVLTVRSYDREDENSALTAEIPSVELTSSESSEYVDRINQEIEEIVDSFIAKQEKERADYKEAFLETGGTEEEWNDRNMLIDVTYDIKYQNGPYLSFVLYNSGNWVANLEERYYYNLDLENNRNITLEDLLGKDYVEIANRSILSQIAERIEKEDLIFWGFNDGSDSDNTGMEDYAFKTVDENTTFYINSDGNPVITFPQYSIGPGYIGVQEFEISGDK